MAQSTRRMISGLALPRRLIRRWRSTERIWFRTIAEACLRPLSPGSITTSVGLKAAGIPVRQPGGWGRRKTPAVSKPANEVTTDPAAAKPANAGRERHHGRQEPRAAAGSVARAGRGENDYPSGTPGDTELQTRIIEAALALLESPRVPVLRDFES
jgi:hypothetical protein